jgi:acetamidase/formamidase
VSSGVVAETHPLAGHWLVSADLFGTRSYMRLNIDQSGDTLSGDFQGNRLTGTIRGSHFHIIAEDTDGTDFLDGEIREGKLTGSMQENNSASNPSYPNLKKIYEFTAELVPTLAAGPGNRRDFEPIIFYREFSPFNAPALHVASGDHIRTTTIDAAGVDRNSQKRAQGGNPQTGPFYIEQAMPGDTLAIHLDHLTLNRDYAVSDDSIVARGMNARVAIAMKDAGKDVRWRLDREHNVATIENPGEHTKLYEVPLRPMLGCIATAPPPAAGAISSGDSGAFGGNMDFNQIAEGSTVYLPVRMPGALLYLGDAHAAQGDGELNGDALETSMDVEFTVEVIRGSAPPQPRVETASSLIALGYAGSLDDAFRQATGNMVGWLGARYHLSGSETAEVIGTAAHYTVTEVADRNAGIALSIDKERLSKLAE